MSKKYSLIKAPQLGTNENSATLVDWSVNDYSYINKGDIICTLETTKSTFEVESKKDGYILLLVKVESEVETGSSLAIVCDSIEELKIQEDKINNEAQSKVDATKSFTATKKAQELASELNINLNSYNFNGIIREKDVRAIYENDNKKRNTPINDKKLLPQINEIKLIGNSKIAKELMTFSKQNIPHSYIEQKIKVNEWIESIRTIFERDEKLTTLVSLIVSALGRTLSKNKMFNSYREGDSIFLYEEINVGIVVANENSLSVPIIKNTNKLNMFEISQELIRMRKSLLLKKPNSDDFVGGTFTVSALDHTEIIRFSPIIHPNQAGVLSIPKIYDEVYVNNKDKIDINKFLNLGLTFDHSYLDANQGVVFMNDLINFVNIEIEKFKNNNE